jgi:hypothetical protein
MPAYLGRFQLCDQYDNKCAVGVLADALGINLDEFKVPAEQYDGFMDRKVARTVAEKLCIHVDDIMELEHSNDSRDKADDRLMNFIDFCYKHDIELYTDEPEAAPADQ